MVGSDIVDFEDVYGWLNKYDHRSHLSEPVTYLVKCIKDTLVRPNIQQSSIIHHVHRIIDDVNQYMTLAKQVVESLDDITDSIEKAEVSLECGWACYHIGDYNRATLEFREASNFYLNSHIHNYAVTLWLLGCTFWRRSRKSDGVIYWERSFRIFDKMKATSPNFQWYEMQSKRMCKTLQQSIDRGYWPDVERKQIVNLR